MTYPPITAKALNYAQGLPGAFSGGEGKIHEKNPKIQKTNQTKSQKTEKTAPFPARTAKKSTKKTSVQNRAEPVITTTNSGGRLPATTSATTSEAGDVLPATPAESAPAAAPALKLNLVGLIATPGGGITDNLVDKATKKNIKVKRLGQQS